MGVVGTDKIIIERGGVLYQTTAGDVSGLGGGGGGSQEVFVQQTRPAGLGPFTWWQTDATGKIINLTIADGNA